MVNKKDLWILEELKDLKKRDLISKPRKRASKGYARFPIAWSVEGNFKDYGIKENGVELKAFASYKLSKDKGGIVLIEYDKREKVKQNMIRKFLNDSNYIIARKNMTDKYANQLYNFCINDLKLSNVDKASNKKLWHYYNKFRDIYTRYEFYSSIWFFVSDNISKLIIQELSKVNCNKFEDIEILMTPRFQSFINKETVDLYESALKIKADLDSINEYINMSFEEFKINNNFKLLTLLKNKYYWIPFGHIGPELYDEEHYFNEIKKIFNSGEDIEKEIETAKLFYSRIKIKQEIIFKKYNLNKKIIRYIRDLHILAQMQDERKELIARTHINWVNNLMMRISRYFNLNIKDACDLEPEIIEKRLLENKLDLTKYYKSKAEKSFMINDKFGYTYYTDEDANIFLEILNYKNQNQNIIKGDGASRGIVRGKVKILLSSNEIGKINRGEILVTTMTTPDFVPAMRKASGIITDEGGVTCHAAIVSREFGLPCIINTQHATEVLKDRDLVELDANKGIIKILNEKEEGNIKNQNE